MSEQTNLILFLHAFKALFLSIYVVYSLGYSFYRLLSLKFDTSFIERFSFFKVVFVYLIGLRLFNLLVFCLGFIGFSFSGSVNLLLGISLLYLAYWLVQGGVSNFWSFKLRHLSLLIPFLFVIFLMLAASYHPIFIWDHYTHWILVPREILSNDLAVGIYDYTRSVAIDYPAHQSHLGAMLFYFWDPGHYSDTLAHMLAPFHLVLVYFLVLQVLLLFTKDTWILLASTGLFLLAATADGGGYLYLTTFYGELFVALSVGVAALGTSLWCAGERKVSSVFPLALVITMPLIAKQYAWPAILVCLALSAFSYGFKRSSRLLFFSLIVFAAETFSVFYLARVATASVRVDRASLISPLVEKTFETSDFLSQTIERLQYLFTQHEGTSIFAALILLVGLVCGSFCLYYGRNLIKNDNSILSRFTSFYGATIVLLVMMIVIEISAVTVFISQAAANSAPRYFSNFYLLILSSFLLSVLVLSKKVSKERVKNTLRFVIIVAVGFLMYPKAEFFNWTRGGYIRMTSSAYAAFPYAREHKRWSKLLQDVAEYKGKKDTIFFFHYGLTSSMINRKWHYLLARKNPNLRILDLYIGNQLDYENINDRILKGKRFKKLFNRKNIGLVLVMQPSYFGKDEWQLFGLFTADDFVKLAQGKKYNVKRSIQERSL